MGQVVVTVLTSLDGVTESPADWGMRYLTRMRSAIRRSVL